MHTAVAYSPQNCPTKLTTIQKSISCVIWAIFLPEL